MATSENDDSSGTMNRRTLLFAGARSSLANFLGSEQKKKRGLDAFLQSQQNYEEEVSSMDTEEDPSLAVDWLSKFLAASNIPKQAPTSPISINNTAVKENATDDDASSTNFKIVTWNIWFSQHYWRQRLEAALAETLRQDPDIFCFQEVRTEVHQCMLDCQFLRERYHPTEERLPHAYDCATWVKRDSRISDGATCTTTLSIESIYGRRGCCCDLELKVADNSQAKLRIVSTHLESGREMETTRRVQLETLLSSINKTPFQRQHPSVQEEGVDAAFLVGDFNLDPSYPENELIEKHRALDVWKALRPNDAGFTENTYRNEMRYLAKGKHKQVRYDRIVMVPSSVADQQQDRRLECKPEHIEILGDRPFDEKGVLWVSDHFGLVATMSLKRAK